MTEIPPIPDLFGSREPADVQVSVRRVHSPAERVALAALDLEETLTDPVDVTAPDVQGALAGILDSGAATDPESALAIYEHAIRRDDVDAWLESVKDVHGGRVAAQVDVLLHHRGLTPSGALESALSDLSAIPAPAPAVPRWQLITVPETRPDALGGLLADGWEPLSAAAVSHRVPVGSALSGSRGERLAVVMVYTLRRLAPPGTEPDALFCALREEPPPAPGIQ